MKRGPCSRLSSPPLRAALLIVLSAPFAARAQGDVVCGFNQAPMPVAGTGRHLCSDGLNAYGPFPIVMRQECRALGQPFCDTPVWPIFFATSLRGFEACPKGSVSEPETPYCSDSTNTYGPFPAALREKCRTAGGGPACDLNAWGRDFTRSLLGLDSAPKPQPTPEPRPDPTLGAVAALVAEIESVRATGAPTYQDAESRGVFPRAGEVDARSEQVYLPFVLGPRRQVDQMVRQLYLLLPKEIRAEVAFVISDRFVQNPRAYLPYLQSRRRVVVVTSFVGIGKATSRAHEDYKTAVARHERELWGLRKTVEVSKALGRPVSSIVLGMGDSTTDFGTAVRNEVQGKVDAALGALDVAKVATPVSWGADELVAIAFARELPEKGVKVWFSNPDARHTWDGRRTTSEIVTEKVRQLRMRVEDATPDVWAVVLSRRPGQSDSYVAGDSSQLDFDEALLRDFRGMPEAEARNTAIIDGRTFNGAWNARATLGRCDLLAYGGWGTFGNNVGQTLAAAKILKVAGNAAARKQMLLEAIAHDVFSIGYAESQAGTMAARLKPKGITFDHYRGYNSKEAVSTVYGELSALVNTRLREHFRATTCLDSRSVRLTPQLWRTFEAETHLWPQEAGEVFGQGVHRTDLPPEIFSPSRGTIGSFDLPKLVAEGCCG